ncbi:cellulose synthase subunit BcsC-related outer membrane protein [Caulobacter sp. DWP3-1-3b2]|uniref:cellulose synthase subunit BcsC-related outer membrane protein n=1 Tax=Caulobacter sp. DWP3-1-3b2 TaxID=2804643 RepID=UPI003CF69D0C
MTDSVIAYTGARDPVTGERYGRVMRSGGGVSLSYDAGQAWPPLMAEVPAGTYGAWLNDQGSPGATTICRDPRARPLVFEHRA